MSRELSESTHITFQQPDSTAHSRAIGLEETWVSLPWGARESCRYHRFTRPEISSRHRLLCQIVFGSFGPPPPPSPQPTVFTFCYLPPLSGAQHPAAFSHMSHCLIGVSAPSGSTGRLSADSNLPGQLCPTGLDRWELGFAVSPGESRDQNRYIN